MITVKLKDKIVAHEPLFFEFQKKIKVCREDITRDVTIYTDRSLNDLDINSKYNIACLVESPEITKKEYDYIENNYKKFDIILTFHKKFLDMNSKKFKLQLYGTTWINAVYRKIYDKSNLCSFISSNKRQTNGHKLRHTIINKLEKNKNIHFYGGKFRKLPYMTTKSFQNEHSGQHITNNKINGLKNYMFSITIENCKSDYYFTEKLIDCFLTGTVPIYWGCPSIYKFFNKDGILSFDTKEECINIVENLSEQKYNEMLPYIKENFETAKSYVRYILNEKEIINLVNN